MVQVLQFDGSGSGVADTKVKDLGYNRSQGEMRFSLFSCVLTLIPAPISLRFLLAILLFFPAAGITTDYGWPLKDFFGVSATFGESRDDHFHAGIDLSTNGDTGLPVLAVADGNIYRLKVQKRGYGRALYLKHADGTVSVYAHLESYSTDLGLEQLYQQKFTETRTRYVGDIFPEPPIRVRKGEVIAYSGESGAGLPHLHFELRRTENTPVNPFTNGFEETLDPIPPTLQACYLYPSDAGSAINGALDTSVVRLEKKGEEFQTEQAPVVRGDFYVSVSAYDSSLRPYHRAPHKLQYSIDNRMLYSVEFNEFSYDDPEGFGLIYDLGKPGPSFFEHPVLMNKPANVPLPFVPQSMPFSTRTLPAGPHRLQIKVMDSSRNTSIAQLNFVVNQPPEIQIEKIGSDESDLIVSANLLDPDWKYHQPSSLSAELQYSMDEGKTFYSFPMTLLDLESSKDFSRLIWRAPLALFNGKRLLIKARGYDGIEYSPYSVVAIRTASAPSIEIANYSPTGKLSVQTFGDAVRVTFDSNEILADPIELQTGSNPYILKTSNLNSYEAVIPVPKMSGSFFLALANQRITLPVHYASKDGSSLITGENYKFDLPAGALYEDTFIWTKPMPAYKAKYLSFIGPMLQLSPRGLALRKKASLAFQYPSAVIHPERLSIYRWSRSNQAWESLPSTVNKNLRTVETRIGYLDLYALIYDNVPPRISYIFPRKNSITRNDTPKLAAEIRDAGMDVDDERVTFYVDDHPYPAEYDPDRNTATLKMSQPLKKGYHRFSVVAHDWAGNKTIAKNVTFRVR